MPTAIGSTPLDDFLAGSGSDTGRGELLQQIGLTGSLGGLLLALGLVVFLVRVHRGSEGEVAGVLRIVGVAGAVSVVGAAVEIGGIAIIDDVSWWDALTGPSGSAPMLRLLAATMVVGGLFQHTERVDDAPNAMPVEPDGAVRWVPAASSSLAYGGLIAGVASFWFDGHTVSRGPRAVHAVVNSVHVVAGAVWFGGLVGLVAIAVLRRRTGVGIAPMLVRFASLATVALLLVGAAGLLMTLMIIDGLGDLTGTDWGRTLLVKVGAVGVVAGLGGYHHFVVVPSLERVNDADAYAARALTTVAVEAAVLVAVVALTVVLTTASTN